MLWALSNMVGMVTDRAPTQGHLLLRTSVCFHTGMPTTPAVSLKHMTHKTVSLSAKPSD